MWKITQCLNNRNPQLLAKLLTRKDARQFVKELKKFYGQWIDNPVKNHKFHIEKETNSDTYSYQRPLVRDWFES